MKIAMLGLRAVGQGAGGVEKAVGELSARLAERGHDVTVFCRTRYNPSGLSSHRGVRLVNLPAIYTKHLEAISHTFLAVWRTLRGFDIVHFHATGPSLLAFVPRLAGRGGMAPLWLQPPPPHGAAQRLRPTAFSLITDHCL